MRSLERQLILYRLFTIELNGIQTCGETYYLCMKQDFNKYKEQFLHLDGFFKLCQQKCGSVSWEIPLSHFTQNCSIEQLKEVRRNINAICY